jgi:hypothetical protein
MNLVYVLSCNCSVSVTLCRSANEKYCIIYILRMGLQSDANNSNNNNNNNNNTCPA